MAIRRTLFLPTITFSLLLGLISCKGMNNATPSGQITPLTLAFGTPLTLPAGSVPARAQSLFVGELDGDTNLDFAILNDTLGVFLGNGDGTFQPRKDATSAVTGPTALTKGEFDGQPAPELVASFPATNQVDIYFDPDRDGAYADNAPFAGGVQPQGVTIADFNDDTQDDIALSNADGNLHVKINTGSVNFNDFSFPSVGKLNNPRDVVAADFNKDNRPDLAFANFGADKVTVWLNSGNANPAFLFPGSNADDTLGLPAGSNAQGIAAFDLNKDELPDIIVPLPTPKQVAIFLNQGGGSFGAANLLPAGNDAFGATGGDYNLDGNQDVVVANAFGEDGVNGDFSVYLGNGDGTFQAPQFFSAGKDAADQPNHPRSVAQGDFNKDGKPDLVFASFPGDSAVVVLNTSN